MSETRHLAWLVLLAALLGCADKRREAEKAEPPSGAQAMPAPTGPAPTPAEDAPAAPPPIAKRPTPPPVESPFRVEGHAHRDEAPVGCFDPSGAAPMWGVLVTLDPERPCPESGSEAPLVSFDIGRFVWEEPGVPPAPLPQPGTESSEKLNLFLYPESAKVDPRASLSELKYRAVAIPVVVRIRAHDPPYVLVNVETREGAELPPGIDRVGGDMAILLPPSSEPYADLTTWKPPER